MKPPRNVPQYGGRPITYSIDPLILRQSEATFIENSLSELLQQVEEFTVIALKDKPLLKKLGVPENLDPRPSPLGLHIPFARFDFLYDGKKLQVLELNTDGTSGFNITEWVASEAGLKESENPNFNLSQRVLNALLEHAPKSREIALIDFPELPTSWEQHDLIERWKPTLSCQVANPGARTWKPGTLAYRRALSWQLRAHPEIAQPFLQDWANKAITVVGTWSSDVGMSKAWPAFIKSRHLPETFILENGSSQKLYNEKDLWILKGALSFSGQSVIRGKDLTAQRWKASLENAISETNLGRPWVAQRMVEIPILENRPFELGLYFLNGKPSGYMCRWGHDKVISETSDEILRPVKIIL